MVLPHDRSLLFIYTVFTAAMLMVRDNINRFHKRTIFIPEGRKFRLVVVTTNNFPTSAKTIYTGLYFIFYKNVEAKIAGQNSRTC